MSFLHLPEDRPWWFLSIILLIAVGLAIFTLHAAGGLAIGCMSYFEGPYPGEEAWQETHDALYAPENYAVLYPLLRYGPPTVIALLLYSAYALCIETCVSRPWATRRWLHLAVAILSAALWVIKVVP